MRVASCRPECWHRGPGSRARCSSTTVAGIDYRPAPEFPYPTPPEDCYRGLAWFEQAGVFGLDTARIAAAGASAGGGLAAGLALLARDRQHVSPCFQLLTFPMLDDRDADVSRRWHRDEMAALGRALNGS